MRLDEDGFQALEEGADAGEGAEKVMAFSKVWIMGKGLAGGMQGKGQRRSWRLQRCEGTG